MRAKQIRVWGLMVLALGASAAAPSTQPAALFDRWYVLLLGEQRAGWSHQWVVQREERITTEAQTEISIQRGGLPLRIRASSRFVETAKGEPVFAESAQTLGALEMRQALNFTPSGIDLTSTQGAQSRSQHLPLPAHTWMPPQAASRYVESQLAAGAKEITLSTIDPSLGPQVVQVNAKIQGPATAEVFGKAVPAIAWRSSVSIMPGVAADEFVDEAGRTIRSVIRIMPGLELTMLQADEAFARTDVNPPELMAATLVTPDRPIAHARMLRQAVYELRIGRRADGSSSPATSQPTQPPSPDLPQAGYQRVVWGEQDIARVVVDLDNPVNPGQDLPKAADLAASLVLNSSDTRIQQLAHEALTPHAGATDAIQAEDLRQFVHRFVKLKDLSVGFATASEVARTAQGDCTEHAVLLAALLRSVKIPSRTVTGLLYVDSFLGRSGVFGYHMWTQAWITDGGGRWVDLDATLVNPFDATHIALNTSSHQDQSGVDDLVQMAGWLGDLEVKVVEAD